MDIFKRLVMRRGRWRWWEGQKEREHEKVNNLKKTLWFDFKTIGMANFWWTLKDCLSLWEPHAPYTIRVGDLTRRMLRRGKWYRHFPVFCHTWTLNKLEKVLQHHSLSKAWCHRQPYQNCPLSKHNSLGSHSGAPRKSPQIFALTSANLKKFLFNKLFIS